MNKRFILELLVGIILLVSVLMFGPKGMAALALLAIYTFFKKKKKKPDEREIQLFYTMEYQVLLFSTRNKRCCKSIVSE